MIIVSLTLNPASARWRLTITTYLLRISCQTQVKIIAQEKSEANQLETIIWPCSLLYLLPLVGSVSISDITATALEGIHQAEESMYFSVFQP